MCSARRQPHVQDADLDLSRQSRRQDGQRAADPGRAAAAAAGDSEAALVVGLVASPERIVQIRQNRLLSLKADDDTSYVDQEAVAAEIAYSRRLCARHDWPIIDVTRRSIEETAAAILDLYRDHRLKFIAV